MLDEGSEPGEGPGERSAGAGLTSSDVLYMNDGDLKRCNRCVMAITDTRRCAVHGPDLEIDLQNGVCGLYVHGAPTTSKDHGMPPMKLVTPSISGYGNDPDTFPGGYSCGRCAFGGGSRCGHPSLDGFAIDNHGGCCNAWTYPHEVTGVSGDRKRGRTVATRGD